MIPQRRYGKATIMINDSPTPNENMTIDEAAHELGLSAATLRMQIRFKALNAHKEGGMWRISPAAIEDYKLHHLGRKGWARRGESNQAAS